MCWNSWSASVRVLIKGVDSWVQTGLGKDIGPPIWC